MVDTPQHFAPALEGLWQVMDEGGYAPHLNATVKRFNGALFGNRKAIALEPDEIRELHIAAGRDWRDVEPAIFGTLLERALDRRERARLGAHYTPRAYVERLVVPTIVEPLRADWEAALADTHALEESGDHEAALRRVKEFHHKLCTTRVLDPACGTGNFLYVSLELMKRLEGEVLDALEGPRRGRAALRHGGRDGRPSPVLRPRTQPPRRRHRRSRALDRLSEMAASHPAARPPFRTRAPSLWHDPEAGRDSGLGQTGASSRRRRQAAFPLGRRHDETPPDHRGGDSRSPMPRWSCIATRTRFRAEWPEAEFIVGNPRHS